MCQQTNTKDIAGQSVREDPEEKMFKREKLNNVNEKEEELMQKMERMENQLENIAYKTNQYVHNMYYIYAKVTLQEGCARNIFFIVGHQLHRLQSVTQQGEGHTLTVRFDFQLLYE